MELPPDQNNNPHLRAQLKRDRDANERFEAGDGTAKAARIRTVEIGTLTAEELEERKGRAQYEARGGQPLQRPRRASDDTYSLVYFNADSSSVMDTLMSGVQRGIPANGGRRDMGKSTRIPQTRGVLNRSASEELPRARP